ncbi:hypothetical protein [Pseudomonas anguilliseptica]|uniref:hypothetical protein n=1 Tax=Pseudomonas anguilliseptica TaxID=53406 RepID=UPI00325ACD3B
MIETRDFGEGIEWSEEQAIYGKGWSEVAMYFWLTSAPADFESGKSIKNDQITHSFLCF